MTTFKVSPKHNDTSPSVQEYIKTNLLKDYSKQFQNFYLHIFQSGYDKYQWIPISANYIRKYYRKAEKEIKKATTARLLRVTPYNKKKHLSRKFQISPDTMKFLVSLILKDRHNKAIPKKIIKYNRHLDSNFYDINRHVKSKIAFNACKNIKTNSPKIIQKILDLLNLKENRLCKTTSEKEIYSIKNDVFNLLKINLKIDKSKEYIPEYRLGKTGRIFEVGGGLQTLSKKSKKFIYSEIPSLYNYDLQSSQFTALIQEANILNIDTQDLINYVNDQNSKFRYARECLFINKNGTIAYSLWKSCLISYLFGSTLNKYYSSPYKLIKAWSLKEGKSCDFHFNKFNEVLVPFKIIFDQWLELIPLYVEKHSYYGKGKKKFKNAVGLSLEITPKLLKEKKFLSAFILQGIESSFIHNLTILSKKYNFQVISNEHDGLITIGKIPKEAIENTKKVSKFNNAILAIKEF